MQRISIALSALISRKQYRSLCFVAKRYILQQQQKSPKCE